MVETAGTPTIRNVALVGHSGAGKTTLAEAVRHRARGDQARYLALPGDRPFSVEGR